MLTSCAAALQALASCHAASLDVQVTGSDGKPLAETVVFLESPEARAATRPMSGVDVAQSMRRFTPRLTVVTVHTAVMFPNMDSVAHNVYSYSPAKTFELKLYKGKPANPVLFDRPGIVVLGCNIHDKMIAWVLVVDTPHFAIADANGQARFADVPAGNYRLRSWHTALPVGAAALEQSLTLGSGAATAAVKMPLTAGS